MSEIKLSTKDQSSICPNHSLQQPFYEQGELNVCYNMPEITFEDFTIPEIELSSFDYLDLLDEYPSESFLREVELYCITDIKYYPELFDDTTDFLILRDKNDKPVNRETFDQINVDYPYNSADQYGFPDDDYAYNTGDQYDFPNFE